MSKPILCLDFDGVLHSYTSGWQGALVIPDPPTPGAIDFLVVASTHFRVAIFSSRTAYWFGRWAMKRAIRRWAEKHFWEIGGNDPPTPAKEFLWEVGAQTYEPYKQTCEEAARRLVNGLEFPRHKPPAMVSVDDRAVTFKGLFPDPGELVAFRTWTQHLRNNICPLCRGELDTGFECRECKHDWSYRVTAIEQTPTKKERR